MSRGFYTTLGVDVSDKIVTAQTAQSTSRSYAFWINYHGIGSDATYSIVCERNSGDETIYLQSGSLMNFFRSFSGNLGGWNWAHPSTDTWVHILITFDGSSDANDPIVYVDGSTVSVSESSGPIGTIVTSATDNFRLGNRAGDTLTFNGMLAQFAMWDSILTSGNATSLAGGALPSSISPGTLIEYLPMLRTDDPVTSEVIADPTVTGTAVQNDPPGFGTTVPSFVGANTVARASSSALGLTRPVASTTNDILIAHIYRRQNTAQALSLPAGWSTLTRGVNTGPDPDLNVELAWKRATSTENSSYTFTWATAVDREGIITAWAGVDSTTATPITEGAWTNSSSSAPTAAAVTASTTNMMLIGTWGITSTNNPSSATALRLASTSNATTVWYELRNSSGTSSAKNILYATSTTFVSQLILLQPTSTAAVAAMVRRLMLMGVGR